MSVKRIIESHLREMAGYYPVITITGPRQSGKTTLAKSFFSKKPYVNLEHPKSREFALNDPEKFLEQYPEGVILDEIQRAPDLLSYIQVIVDEKKQKAMFILTGSQQFSLIDSINQSLAGRTAMLTLLPFSLEEIRKNYLKENQINYDDLIIRGAYPRAYNEGLQSRVLYRDYLSTYIERDLRQISEIKNLDMFQSFVKLCAGRVGQVLNLSNIGSELGVSHNTIKEWISILRASYIVFLLPHYSNNNIKKQIVKSPKLYFYDTGLASYLLDIYEKDHLTNHPLKGALFENFVVSEILKTRFNQGLEPNLYFYRDKSCKEVDIIYKIANKVQAIEIKSAKTFHESFFDNLEYFSALLGKQVEKKYLIYSGEAMKRSKAELINPLGIYKALS
jgi:predicted AAA+ superfamily ATPase